MSPKRVFFCVLACSTRKNTLSLTLFLLGYQTQAAAVQGMGLSLDTDESDSDTGDILEDWDSFMHYTADDSDSDF